MEKEIKEAAEIIDRNLLTGREKRIYWAGHKAGWEVFGVVVMCILLVTVIFCFFMNQ